MKFKNLAVVTGLAVSGVIVSSVIASANAAIFNVDGTEYDVTILPADTFDAQSATLESQPWWTKPSLAIDFANQVADSFGYPNISTSGAGPIGPRFAYDLSGTTVSEALFVLNTQTATSGTVGFSVSTGYAVVATAVPEPSTILGAVVGLGLIGGLKRKLG